MKTGLKMESKSVLLPIDIGIRFHQLINYPILISLKTGKLIEIEYQKDRLKEVLSKFKDKGLKQIFLKEEDHQDFQLNLKELLSDEKMENLDSENKNIFNEMKSTAESFNLIKEQMKIMGFKKDIVEKSKDIYKRSLSMIKKNSGLLELFKDFKETQFQDFTQNLFIVCVSNSMISSFDWQSPTIMEKASLAILLSDINQIQEEQTMLKNYYYKKNTHIKLTENILNHATNTANFFAQNVDISKETVQMIREHHLRPDGTGFPLENKEAKINISPLSAIYILARHFVELLYLHDFDMDLKEMILHDLEQKYHYGNFKKAFLALKKAIS